MRNLTAAEVTQVSGAHDIWVFTGEPVSVPNIEKIKNNFYSSVFDGAIGGAVGAAAIRSPVGILMGTIAGATLAGAQAAYTVSLNVPMVTYTPVITIYEIGPGTSYLGGC